MPITTVLEFNVGSPIRHFRCAPLRLGGAGALLVVHSACEDVDPYHRMFFLPTDTLKISVWSLAGERLWQVDLGGGMIPGTWFCPVLGFDLDGNGCDEVWLVNNPDRDHPLNYEDFALERRDGRTGEVLSRQPWPVLPRVESMSSRYRNFLNAAYRHGGRRLICAQGTYGDLQLQCHDEALRQLWQRRVGADDPGPRGSHMFPVVDINGDGRDELLYGERCIDVDTGEDIWVGDRGAWSGHSDVIQPTLDRKTGQWCVYTCRESRGGVVCFDNRGRELWGHRDLAHTDMGWTARLGEDGSHRAYALEIGAKSAGPEGFRRSGQVEHLYDMAGRELDVPFSLFGSLPVDVDGDGLHELVYAAGERVGAVVDRTGRGLARLDGSPFIGSKLLDLPGEQVVTRDEAGTVRIYADTDAEDVPAARARYEHPYYPACQRAATMGYNRANLGGL